jgi:phosphate transport system substrate-binding protein
MEKRIAALAIAMLLLLGCASRQESSQLKLGGSDTMVVLGQRWAEQYMSQNPGSSVSVTGGGSGVGIAAIIDGTTDIAQSSRDMKEAEIASANSKGVNPLKTIVAYDGIAIIVNIDNPMESLTMEQARQIFTGNTTNWRDVGGKDEKISIYSRESSSGTYEFMKEHVLKKADYAASAKYSAGSAVLVQSVAQDRTAIGYTGVAYTKGAGGVKVLPISAGPSSQAYLPDKEHVKSGAYPIARSLNFYTNGEPTGSAKGFVDFVLSESGQKIVEEVGYFRAS